MIFSQMFTMIEDYHKLLGHTKPRAPLDRRMNSVRSSSLALIMEIAELVDSLPWKPWRSLEDQNYNIDNVKREMIDIIFFLVAICEDLRISAEDLEIKFHEILKNNYKRLDNGYSLKGGDVECQSDE